MKLHLTRFLPRLAFTWADAGNFSKLILSLGLLAWISTMLVLRPAWALWRANPAILHAVCADLAGCADVGFAFVWDKQAGVIAQVSFFTRKSLKQEARSRLTQLVMAGAETDADRSPLSVNFVALPAYSAFKR
ncbi:hypothetical protein [Roseateles albus]|uniref:Uncharacterized protein n=1 Tax=Roseateles albus TaxID=2987525 RepID=A0ABT5KHY7_9BURK|nr:hypothetical protein [Roseateles albus]MDC8773548.1 hypothetical protein [Roseateles albus]